MLSQLMRLECETMSIGQTFINKYQLCSQMLLGTFTELLDVRGQLILVRMVQNMANRI